MFFLTLSLVLYFAPALLASSRHHPRETTIWWVNALAGWTFVGWVVCLVWALSEPRRAPTGQLGTVLAGQYGAPAYPAGWSAASATASARSCPACARPTLSAASFCTMCGATLQ